MEERFLVTGSAGCLGAWAVHLLVDEGTPVIAGDISEDRRRLHLLRRDEELTAVDFVRLDVADRDQVAAVVRDEGVTHIVHLAALQVPFAKADPVRGAQVNVVGTVNMLEAARHSAGAVQGLSYASSIAVFGPADLYPEGLARDDSPAAPATLYGVYKQANEWTARVYARDWGVMSVGLRPCIVYGPGRDQGMTSGPTRAIVDALAGIPHHIEFGGRSVFQHAEDVARLFIQAARAQPQGAEVLNLGGPSVAVADVVAAIVAEIPEAEHLITHAERGLPFPERYDGAGLDRLVGGARYMDIGEGIARSVARFRELLQRGLVTPSR